MIHPRLYNIITNNDTRKISIAITYVRDVDPVH